MRIGISSYTYTWAVGVPGHLPAQTLGVLDLVERAHSLGVPVLQVADNLPLDQLPEDDLNALAARARALGVSIEIGTRGIDADYIARYLSLAQLLGSPLLRVIIAQKGRELTPDEAISILKPQQDAFESAGVTLAIENHDKFSTDELVHVVQELGTDWAGICLDTVNSFGALEGPGVVVDKLGPFAVNLHVKDFAVRRAEHMMGFEIEGRPAGEGQLNVTWLLDKLGARDRNLSAIIELWTPPGPTLEATIATEGEWAERSVHNLKKLLCVQS
jgi:sugar phosphate isomerase/epimerase